MERYKKIEAEAPPGSFSQYDISVILPELEKLSEQDVYLEVGVQYGRSLYIASKYSKAKTFGVDIEPTLCTHWLDGLDYSYDWRGSDELAKEWGRPVSVLFIDGDHTYKGVKADWRNFSKFVKAGGVIFFHDCDETSPGVVQLFKEIKDDPNFTDFKKYKKEGLNTSLASCRRI
jgi:hypothetical protein